MMMIVSYSAKPLRPVRRGTGLWEGLRRRHAFISAVKLLLFSSGALSAASAPAQATGPAAGEFVAMTSTLAAKADGSALGEVTPATPVTVVANTGGKAEIAIEGWSLHDAPQYLYPEIGQRIILTTLEQVGQDARTIESSQADRYGISWDKVKITGWIPSANLVDNSTTIWQAAQAIFQARCSACHALHQPTEFTANQWPSILKIMTMRAALSPADTELVTKYLQLHARVPGAGRGPGPGHGPGARRN